MSGRIRSPKYPSTSLEHAIDLIRKIHREERTNTVDREVAAKALGYSGISGRSATILADLIQYGLLEKAGKNEVRVSKRAVEILHPDSAQTGADALLAAAQEPELFQRIMERFVDGSPSRNALESFLIKEGFSDTAVPSAIRAFQDTTLYVENTIESESHLQLRSGVEESEPNQEVERGSPMHAAQHTQKTPIEAGRSAGFRSTHGDVEKPIYQVFDNKIWLGGVVANQKEAKELVTFINAMMPLLRSSDDTAVNSEADAASLPVSSPRD